MTENEVSLFASYAKLIISGSNFSIVHVKLYTISLSVKKVTNHRIKHDISLAAKDLQNKFIDTTNSVLTKDNWVNMRENASKD